MLKEERRPVRESSSASISSNDFFFDMSTGVSSLGGLSSKVPELQASELQMERSINLEELELTVGNCHRRRLECIIFVNRVEVYKSDLLWMTSSRRVDGDNC